MANDEQLSILRKGVDVWNEWRDTNPEVHPNLAEADLRYANLQYANLTDVSFVRAGLDGADLSDASLRSAELSGAHLLGARLIRTRLDYCIFDGSYLTGADFDLATMRRTKFDNVDLAGALNLETVVHRGPSNISVDTLFISNGTMPEIFLKGCGFSDYQLQLAKLAKSGLDRDEITTLAYDLVNMYCGIGIKYNSCFIK